MTSGLADGQWHMITVTTLSGGQKVCCNGCWLGSTKHAGLLTHLSESLLQGFSLYVDGQLNATSKAPQAFWHTDGGDPIMTEAPIVLCGRSDHASSSGFNGKLAGLSVWDGPLSSDQVKSLWQAAQSRSAGGSAILAPAPAPGPQPGSGGSSPSAAPEQAPAKPSSLPASNPTQSGAPFLSCRSMLAIA